MRSRESVPPVKSDPSKNVGAKHSGDNLSDKTIDFMSECFAQTVRLHLSGKNLSDKTIDFMSECFAQTERLHLLD